MKLENQVTSLELSKKMKELGAPQESLFYWTGYYNGNSDIDFGRPKDSNKYNIYSAYTVAELGEMLPNKINQPDTRWVYFLKSDVSDFSAGYADVRDNSLDILCFEHADTEADARGAMWVYLKENGLI